MKKSKLQNKLDKFPNKNFEVIEAVYDKENKIIYVDYDFMSKLFNVGKSALSVWFNKKGAIFTAPAKLKYFTELPYIIKWHNENIDKSKSMQGQGLDNRQKLNEETPSDMESFLDTLPVELRESYMISNKDALDKIKDITEILKRQVALQKEKGELVEADIPNKALAELATIQIGLYKQDLIRLPTELNNKFSINKDEVRDILKGEYKHRIKSLKKIADIESEHKIIDILHLLVDKLENNSVDDIIKVLNEL